MIAAVTIVVADDSPEDRELLATSLRQAGYGVIEFANGDEVKDHLLKSPALPDLIITDWKMPKVDGIELCRLIKQTDHLSAIPVMILTGYMVEELDHAQRSEQSGAVRGGISSGADQVLSKQTHPEALLRYARMLISLRKGQTT